MSGMGEVYKKPLGSFYARDSLLCLLGVKWESARLDKALGSGHCL